MNVSAVIDFRFQGFKIKLKNKKVIADCILVQFPIFRDSNRSPSESREGSKFPDGENMVRDP